MQSDSTFTIAEFNTSNGLIQLLWNENLGLHIRHDGVLVGWLYKSNETAEYTINLIAGETIYEMAA